MRSFRNCKVPPVRAIERIVRPLMARHAVQRAQVFQFVLREPLPRGMTNLSCSSIQNMLDDRHGHAVRIKSILGRRDPEAPVLIVFHASGIWYSLSDESYGKGVDKPGGIEKWPEAGFSTVDVFYQAM